MSAHKAPMTAQDWEELAQTARTNGLPLCAEVFEHQAERARKSQQTIEQTLEPGWDQELSSPQR